MTAKKKVLTYLIFSCLCISTLPIANFIFTTKFSELKKLKVLEIKKKLLSLDLIERKINKVLYYYGINAQYNEVIIGNEGYLFLGVAHNPLGVNYQYGLADNDTIEKAVINLKNKQDYLDKKNIQSLIVIIPDKESIYQNKIPIRFGFKKNVFTDLFLEHAMQKKLRVLFAKNFLKPDKKQTYSKTDTHWNHYGSYLGYNKTMDELYAIYNVQLKKIDSLTFFELVIDNGDLARFLKINNEKDIYDKDLMWNSSLEDYIINRCKFSIDKEKKFSDCQKIKNIITDVNQQTYYTFNKNALNKKKLLWIRDSFGNNNSPLYQVTFEKIIQIHHSYLDNNTFHSLIDKEKPDYVILQVVERGIYTSVYTTEPL